jgi:hypothetical protein
MAKIILEFDALEDAQDARTALDGWKWKMAMWDLDQLLRSTAKHGVSLLDPKKEASSEEMEVAYKIREEIREILTNSGLNLED